MPLISQGNYDSVHAMFSSETQPTRCDYEELHEHTVKLWANTAMIVDLVTHEAKFSPTKDMGK